MRRDAGYTLVELLVALVLLLLALAMFGSAFVVVQRTSAQQLERGVTTNQIRQALVLLDAQMRSGYATKAFSVGGDRQVVIYTESTGSPRCAGWRLTAADPQKLWFASWAAGGSAPTFPLGWTLMASGIRNGVVQPGVEPFTMKLYPDATNPNAVGIALGVQFWVATRASASVSEMQAGEASKIATTFTTRNVRRYDTVVPSLNLSPRVAC